MAFLHKILNLLRTCRLYYSLFSLDAVRFLRLVKAKNRYLARISINCLNGNEVFARSLSADAGTLISCFHQQYHLPPTALNESPVIVDLGANVGYTMRHLKFLYPKATIIGVEMDWDNYQLCLENVKSLPGCSVLHAAISATNGRVSYVKNTNEDAYYIVGAMKGASGKAACETIEVDSITIHDVFATLHVEKIDYLKMDVEGAENMLFNSSDLSWLHRIGSLNIEVHNDEYYGIIFEKLQQYQFECWKDNKHWSAIMAVSKDALS